MSSAETGSPAAHKTAETRPPRGAARAGPRRGGPPRAGWRGCPRPRRSRAAGSPERGSRLPDAGAPALLDAAEAPDRERERPREHEQADHQIAHEVEVDVVDHVEHAE